MSMLPRSLLAIAGLGAAAATGVYALDARAGIHEHVLCPLIRTFTDAETGHKLGIWAMKHGLAPKLRGEDRRLEARLDPVLAVDVFGKHLRSPIGLAAGLDKDAEAVDALFDTGFLYVEVGLVTPEPQPGNPAPRFWRLPRDDAVINRYGFNSLGHFNVVANLAKRALAHALAPTGTCAFRPGKLLAVNLGKNKTGDEIADYTAGVRRLAAYADVLVVNVLSPNTPGLRDLQSEDRLAALLQAVVAERGHTRNVVGDRPPVLVKIAPDLTAPELEAVAHAAVEAKVDGIVVLNTTVQRPLTLLTTDSEVLGQAGGLLGPPLKPYALQALRTLRKHTKGTGLVLVGCGGILSGADALEFGKAGASFVQLYTAFAYKGPGLPAKVRDELAALLQAEGKTWLQIVGADDP